ncbi:hypothetical protein EDB83DRAFT_2229756 [Lactarius deliciosus]|nr:hypothetical protein EDB83DRAFT_2229756 [Lactarius deliciosus]
MSEPQSREILEQHSNKLLAEFDTQLKIIADRYLAFFQRRSRVTNPASYLTDLSIWSINSLLKLHHDASKLDPANPRIEPTTTRAAWNKIRDNLEREVNTRQHFVNTLDTDVIGPLTTLKASREHQTRLRIRENLKNHSRAYVNHVENNISRLQQAYLKKYHYDQDGSNNWLGGKVSTLFRGRRGLKYAESEDTGMLVPPTVPTSFTELTFRSSVRRELQGGRFPS